MPGPPFAAPWALRHTL